MPDFRVYVGADLVALGKNATLEHARSIAAGLKATYPRETVRLKIGRNVEVVDTDKSKTPTGRTPSTPNLQNIPIRKPR